ncbi:hypothetical protein Nepgr_013206 [Nepenthes gracilis]|uniref:Creatinase N-terminal domain-containing protein n=1 Tax=Nepenthes gracilis TaxID=150966 RepID=A0AAD3SIF7_NEPGR|nr:hypothetical protein Nepgr_013206 [Nepenthes gracilis]
MGTLPLASASIAGKPFHSYYRCSHFLSLSLPFFPELKSDPLRFIISPNCTSFTIRSCGSITAKPSSEFRKRNRCDAGQDDKLRALRELFSKPGVGVDAYIIPSQDAHQSEFIAECYMRRAYISGFTGSAGTAVVTKDKAALWTDGRYFLQAEKQLSSSWILMRAGNIGVPTTAEWLNDVLAPGCRVGIDPFLFSSDASEELKEDLSQKNHELVLLYNINLVDEIWKQLRPKPPSKPVRLHDLKYAGEDVLSKLSLLRSQLADAGCTAIAISRLDEVAWLLNLRGNDVPHSPVMYSYLVVETDGAKLFIDDYKITPEVMDHLKSADIELRPYESILEAVENLAVRGACLWLDTSSVNAAIVNTFKSSCDKHSIGHRNEMKAKPETNGSSNGQLDGPAGVYRSSRFPLLRQ